MTWETACHSMSMAAADLPPEPLHIRDVLQELLEAFDLADGRPPTVRHGASRGSRLMARDELVVDSCSGLRRAAG